MEREALEFTGTDDDKGVDGSALLEMQGPAVTVTAAVEVTALR